jgi:hypothetical protein
MAVTKVLNKKSEIDGKPIEWFVLAITGYISGDFQTLELKLTKTEAMLANLLLNSSEELSVVNGGKGEDVQVNRNKG